MTRALPWAVPFALLAALLAILSVAVIAGSVREADGGLSLRGYARVAGEPVYWKIFGNTLATAVVVATAALALALFAVSFNATLSPRMQALFAAASMLPLITPTLVRTLGWLMSLQNRGFLEMLTGGRVPFNDLLFTRAGVAVALVHAYYPAAYIYALAAARRIRPREIETAAMLGAGTSMIVRKIVLPRIGGLLAAIWVFLTLVVLGAVVAPELLGGSSGVTIYRVIDTRLNVLLDVQTASAYSLLIAAFVIAVAWTAGRVIGVTGNWQRGGADAR